jgi:hypothetical protein
MKYILLLFLLTSCTAYQHLKKAEKHTRKAIAKGATIEKDTLRIAISDTITDIDTLDNYIRVTKTIRDTLYIQGNTTYIAKSRTEVRQEQKTERKKIKEENKTQRKQVKQDYRTRRNRAFNWLVTGICVFFGVVLFLIARGTLEPK